MDTATLSRTSAPATTDCADAPGQPCALIAHRFGGAVCRRCDRTVSRFALARSVGGERSHAGDIVRG